MSESAFQTFVTAGVLLLVAGVLAIGYLLWRIRDDREDAERAALEGVSQELRLTLQRFLAELINLRSSEAYKPGSLMDIKHPQLDAVHTALVFCDRRAISVMGAMYQELSARKQLLRAELVAGEPADDAYDNALSTTVDGIVTLYLWDEHGGCKPPDARTTRSWDVRKWMIENGFGQFAFEDMHLRDTVVERLRGYGMTLTPRPLEYTAFEYWSMRYDRQKDRGVFGARRERPDPDIEDEVEAEEELIAEEALHDTQIDIDDVQEIAEEGSGEGLPDRPVQF